MIKINEELRAALISGNYSCNVRISFPNKEYEDITNDSIVEESLEFVESICSGSSFSLGIVESPSITFETVGVPNLKDKIVSVSLEIFVNDTKYTIKYGTFKITDSKKSDGINKRKHKGLNSILNTDINLNKGLLHYLNASWFTNEVPSRLYISDLEQLYFKNKYIPTHTSEINPEDFEYKASIKMFDIMYPLKKIEKETQGFEDRSVTLTISGKEIHLGLAAFVNDNNLNPYWFRENLKEYKHIGDTIASRQITKISLSDDPKLWNAYKKANDDICKDIDKQNLLESDDKDLVVSIAMDWEDGSWNDEGEDKIAGKRTRLIPRREITKSYFDKLSDIDDQGGDYKTLTIKIYYWDEYSELMYAEELMGEYSKLYQDHYIIDPDAKYVSFSCDLQEKSSTKLKEVTVRKAIEQCVGSELSVVIPHLRPTIHYYGTRTPVRHHTNITYPKKSSDRLYSTYKDPELEWIYKDATYTKKAYKKYEPWRGPYGTFTFDLSLNNDDACLGYGLEEVLLDEYTIEDNTQFLMNFLLVSFESAKGKELEPGSLGPPDTELEYFKAWGRNCVTIPTELNVMIDIKDNVSGKEYIRNVDCSAMKNKIFSLNTSLNSAAPFHDGVHNIIPKVCIADSDKKISSEADKESLDFHIDFKRTVKNQQNRKGLDGTIVYGTDPETGAITWEENYKKHKTEDGKWANKKDWEWDYHTPNSDFSSLDVRSVMASYSELNGQIGKINRDGDFELFDINSDDILTPSETVYPSDSIYPACTPYGPTKNYAGSIMPSKWRKLTWDDVKIKPFAKITCTYNNARNKGEPSVATYFIEGTYPDGYKTYDISDNLIIKNSVYTPTQINTILENISNKINNLKYVTCDIDLIGLPHIEAGDVIQVIDNNGIAFSTIIFKRTLSGIQMLSDNIEVDLSDDDDGGTYGGASYSGGSTSSSGGSSPIYGSGVSSINGETGDVTIKLPSYYYDAERKAIIFSNINKL